MPLDKDSPIRHAAKTAMGYACPGAHGTISTTAAEFQDRKFAQSEAGIENPREILQSDAVTTIFAGTPSGPGAVSLVLIFPIAAAISRMLRG